MVKWYVVQSLPLLWDSMRIIEFEQIDSTNEYIKRNIGELNHFTVVQSQYQSKGKGRNGHVWHSTKGENILLSFLIKDSIQPNMIHHYTQIAALSVIQLLQEYQVSALIKWPNDIFVNDQKIAGILVEAVFQDTIQGVVIGIGLNVNTNAYQSMASYLNRELDLTNVRDNLILKFSKVYEQYNKEGYQNILATVNTLSYLKDKPITYAPYGKVLFKELLENGMIVIEDQNDKQSLSLLQVNEISLSQD